MTHEYMVMLHDEEDVQKVVFQVRGSFLESSVVKATCQVAYWLIHDILITGIMGSDCFRAVLKVGQMCHSSVFKFNLLYK